MVNTLNRASPEHIQAIQAELDLRLYLTLLTQLSQAKDLLNFGLETTTTISVRIREQLMLQQVPGITFLVSLIRWLDKTIRLYPHLRVILIHHWAE